MNPFAGMPWLYVLVGLLWSVFQGLRGAWEQAINSQIKWDGKQCYGEHLKSSWDRWVVLYVHDFAFRFVCTAAGFVALFVAYRAFTGMEIQKQSAGALVFVAFAFVVGVIGVGGQLHNILLAGKLPGMKG